MIWAFPPEVLTQAYSHSIGNLSLLVAICRVCVERLYCLLYHHQDLHHALIAFNISSLCQLGLQHSLGCSQTGYTEQAVAQLFAAPAV